MSNQREFLHPTFVRKPADAAGTAAGLDYPSTLVGTTGNVTIYYATSLGEPGLALANAMLGAVTGPYNDMETFFGIAGGPVTVVIAPLSGNNEGGGGAYHYGCDFTSGGTMYLDATFALPNSVDVELALYVAELSECFMGAQGLGWGCGSSNGEGLSRFCAEVDTPPGSFPAWGITGPSWVSAGYPDWVTTTEQTDRDYASTGCAVLYIYWMLSLGYTKEQVIQAGGATLADNYQALTGKATAYADLTAAVQAVTVTSDNPFYPLTWRQMANTAGFGNLNDGQHLFFTGDFAGTGHAQVLFYDNNDNNWQLGDFAGGGWQQMANTAGFGNLLDGQHLFWTGDFTGAGHTQVLFYDANNSDWQLGDFAGGGWQSVANTAGFGNLNDGQHLFFTGDFAGTGHAQVLFYDNNDNNWQLGDFAGGGWQQMANTAGFGNLLDGQHLFWTGDFTGAGHTQVLFYDANNSDWQLGDFAGGGWQSVANTAGFGNLNDGQHLFFTGDFAGTGHAQVLFYDNNDNNWQLGDFAGGGWQQMANTAGFGNLLDGQHLFWTGDFTGAGHTQVLFYDANNSDWQLGDFAGGGWQSVANTAGFGNLNDGQHLFWTGDFAGTGHAQVLFYDANNSDWELGAIAL